MSTWVSNNKKDFEPAPEGLHRAVCVDVVDLGMQDTAYGQKRKVQIRWQIEELRSDGKPFLVLKKYTASLHKKSKLRPDLESWRGKGFTDEETEKLDLDNLIGKQCQLNVTHVSFADGGIFAAVNAVVPAPRGMPPLVAQDYKRVCDRDGYQAPPVEEEEIGAPDVSETYEEEPFPF